MTEQIVGRIDFEKKGLPIDRVIEIVKNWMNDTFYVTRLDDSLEDLENRLKLADALENGVGE